MFFGVQLNGLVVNTAASQKQGPGFNPRFRPGITPLKQFETKIGLELDRVFEMTQLLQQTLAQTSWVLASFAFAKVD